MNPKRKSFLIYKDSLNVLDDLTNEQAGMLFKAIKSYQSDDEINVDSIIKIALSPFKSQFDRDNEKYEKLCEKNRLIAENRYKSVVTKSTSGNESLHVVTKSTDNDSDSDSDSDSKDIKNISDSGESNTTKKADKVPYQKIADLYRSILVDTGECGMSLVNMQTLTTKRKTAIKKYWTREGKHGVDRVEQYFIWLWNNRSDHSWIFGTEGKWKADLEYLLREETISKAREQRLGNFGGNQQ